MKDTELKEMIEKAISNNKPFYFTNHKDHKFFCTTINNDKDIYVFKVNNNIINQDYSAIYNINDFLVNSKYVKNIQFS